MSYDHLSSLLISICAYDIFLLIVYILVKFINKGAKLLVDTKKKKCFTKTIAKNLFLFNPIFSFLFSLRGGSVEMKIIAN